MINKKRLIRLTQQLIRIDSQNPPGDEFLIARFIKKYLGSLGVKAKIYEFKKKRSNVVACFEGKSKQQSLLLTPHLDTVSSGKSWHYNPFLAKINRGRIYGLGATDCKGNLACGLEAINSLIEDKIILNYNLVFAATADEESGSSLGLIPLLNRGILKPDMAVVLDSDDFNIIITQKGLIHLKVKLLGKRAHGAYPWRGINAIDIAAAIIKALKSHQWEFKRNKYLKGATLNIGTIKGGDKVNIVADWWEFELDFRFLPGSSVEEILKEIKIITQKQVSKFYHKNRIPQNALKIEIEGIQQPYSIEEDHPLVNYMKEAMWKVNVKPIIKGSEGATTITFFQNKNIPAIATGFGAQGCAHIVDEYVRIDNLYRGALVLENFCRNFLVSVKKET